MHGPPERWRPLAELYLFLAAREDHLHRAILPGTGPRPWVLCDRFANSTRVYQGFAGGLGLELVDALQAPLLGAHRPDLTLVLDLPVEVGMARCAARGAMARFEAKGARLSRAGPRGFLRLAAASRTASPSIDASGDEAAVADDVWRDRRGQARPRAA